MANIKISELNELYEAQRDYNDYVPVVDTSADETKKISVKNLTASGVQLIAVSDTDPEEYETGDKYYNTTDNRIYTATSSGWANPQTPIRNIFYIILETQNIYTYDMDNETLVSVGGGASGGGGDSTPIGQVSMYAGSTAPDGFLMCDGSAVSRETYKDLYRVIGTTYGTGDGSTTFNLPNIKGKVVVMLDSNDTDFDTLGETGGSKYLQEHKHKWANDNGRSYAGAYGWNYSAPASGSNFPAIDDTSANTGGVLTTGTGGVQTGNSGNLQPYIVLNYIIKVQKLAGEVLSEELPVGTEVDFDGSASDIPIGWEQVDNILWENTNPTSNFAGQTINLETNSYTEYNVYYKINNSLDYVRVERVVVGTLGIIVFPTTTGFTSNNSARWLTAISNQSITFGDATTGGTTSNNLLIPIKVVGVN